ncbi:MAG TPA: hypothetical protein VM432_07245 [Bdellovibrionales bacterium]|nr:hypothetical protein [Bdellovibrionales bacterium]
MRTGLVFLALAFASIANANANDTYQVPQNTVALKLISGVPESVEWVDEACPGEECEPLMMVSVRFRLPGCNDKIGPVASSRDRLNGKFRVRVTAFAAVSAADKSGSCKSLPEVVVKVPAGYGFSGLEDINVEFEGSLD